MAESWHNVANFSHALLPFPHNQHTLTHCFMKSRNGLCAGAHYKWQRSQHEEYKDETGSRKSLPFKKVRRARVEKQRDI